jgi:hypothetical protein
MVRYEYFEILFLSTAICLPLADVAVIIVTVAVSGSGPSL